MRAWSQALPVEMRSPSATRPWQHVLEPLSGYLSLGQGLSTSSKYHGEQYNFGPKSGLSHTVKDLLDDLRHYWSLDQENAYIITDNIPFHEAELLKLNCDKALSDLKWEATLDYAECIKFVGEWYNLFYRDSSNIKEFTLSQIREYESIASSGKKAWSYP